MNEEVLYMARLQLDARRLAQLAERQRLPPGHEDTGFLVHAQLAALFGDSVLRPFRALDKRDQVEILGYTRIDSQGLVDRAKRFADPADYAACDWNRLATKPMPPSWRGGERLGFEVRVCPIVRLARDATATDRSGQAISYSRGAEVDAWVHGRWLASDGPGAGADVTREAAYAGWLTERCAGAAAIESAHLLAFRRLRLVRRTQGSPRRARILERPEAILRGILVVEEDERFRRLLAGGVGRHTGFGFGMLLLRAGD